MYKTKNWRKIMKYLIITLMITTILAYIVIVFNNAFRKYKKYKKLEFGEIVSVIFINIPFVIVMLVLVELYKKI